MKAFTLALVLFALVPTFITAPARAAGKQAGDIEAAAAAQKKQDAQKEMMKKYMEYATPGAPHATLKSMVGNWRYHTKMWEAEGAPAQESDGTSKMTMIMGGRYLQQNAKGKAMGMDFEGMGLIGYDNVQKQFQTTWIDSMSTGMMHGAGAYDDATKTLNDQGTFTCPMSQNPARTFRTEWKMTDKDHSVFSMFSPDLASGKEYKMMELAYTRTK